MEQLSKAKLKLFGSLLLKKYREREGLFLAEGIKMAEEALASGLDVEGIVCASDVPPAIVERCERALPGRCWLASPADYARMCGQVSPEGVTAVVHEPRQPPLPEKWGSTPLLLLDGIQDPGNLGTLIRSAEWFGFGGVICSSGTADAYNPKALRASMGSIFRVPVWYPEDFLSAVKGNAAQVWVADAKGEPLSQVKLRERSCILVGSESHGPSPEVLGIPGIRLVAIQGHGRAESLNAAVAGSLLAYAWQQA